MAAGRRSRRCRGRRWREKGACPGRRSRVKIRTRPSQGHDKDALIAVGATGSCYWLYGTKMCLGSSDISEIEIIAYRRCTDGL